MAARRSLEASGDPRIFTRDSPPRSFEEQRFQAHYKIRSPEDYYRYADLYLGPKPPTCLDRASKVVIIGTCCFMAVVLTFPLVVAVARRVFY